MVEQNILTKTKNRLTWEPPQSALEKWDAKIYAAASDDENAIAIYDYVGADWQGEGATVKKIDAALKSIGAENPVTVNINSPGGDMFEGMAIYNALQQHKGKVTVKVLGLAASAASIIAMAGDEIQVAKAGFLMIHNAWVFAMGNRNDLEDMVKILEPFDDAMAGVYADRSGESKKEIAKMMDSETWMNGEQAVEQGFATALLPSDKIEKSETGTKAYLARIDAALAKDGMSRAERRRAKNEFLSTLRATENITPRADENKQMSPADKTKALLAILTK